LHIVKEGCKLMIMMFNTTFNSILVTLWQSLLLVKEACMPMYNLPDVYSTTSTVPSTANLHVVAACSMWLSVNTGSQSWWYWVDSVDIVFVGCCEWPMHLSFDCLLLLRELPLWILDNYHVNKCNMNDRRMKISTIKTSFC
jgi:hypothetical protein